MKKQIKKIAAKKVVANKKTVAKKITTTKKIIKSKATISPIDLKEYKNLILAKDKCKTHYNDLKETYFALKNYIEPHLEDSPMMNLEEMLDNASGIGSSQENSAELGNVTTRTIKIDLSRSKGMGTSNFFLFDLIIPQVIQSVLGMIKSLEKQFKTEKANIDKNPNNQRRVLRSLIILELKIEELKIITKTLSAQIKKMEKVSGQIIIDSNKRSAKSGKSVKRLLN